IRKLPRHTPLMPCNRAMEIRRTVPRLMRIVAKTFLTLVFCGALLWMNACSVGPNYKRPAANVPTAYRGALAGEAAAGESTPAPPSPVRSGGAGSVPLGEEKWWEVFEDQELQGLSALRRRITTTSGFPPPPFSKPRRNWGTTAAPN